MATILDQIKNNEFNIRIFDPQHPLETENTILGILVQNIQTIILSIAGILFVLMFVLGGVQYIASGGDEKRAESGKKTLTYAVGGLILTVLAGVIPNTIVYLAKQTSKEGTLYGAINVVLNYILAGVAMLTVLFLIIGGIRFITSRGDPAQLTKAKKTITYAVVGLIAVILSGVVLNLITYFLGTLF